MKKILIFLLLNALINAANDINEINKNIQQEEQKQKAIDKQRQNLNMKLSTLGQNISNNVAQIKKLDLEIQNLAKNIESNKDQNKSQEVKLQNLQLELATNNAKMDSLQKELSNLILRFMTFSQVLDDEEVRNIEDMITREAFNVLKSQTTQNITKIQNEQKNIAKKINDINANIKQVTQIITTQETRQQDLQSMIARQRVLVDNMRGEMQAYNQRIKEIDAQKKELDNLLTKLNILKKNTQAEMQRKEKERQAKLEKERLARLEKERQKKLEEAKEKARKEKELAEKKAKEEAEKIAKTDTKKAQEFLDSKNKEIEQGYQATISKNESASAIDSFEDLKRIDSVYQKPPTAKYSGKKLISPLDSYTIEQSFGDYIDPVYKIKVFNNGVVLKPKAADAQVYNIMDGKVVYAQEMIGLKKVVVVESANKFYVIYSMLDKIPPTIKSGFIVSKGYVIGRVNERLNLEILQDEKHINPMEVITRK